MNELDRFEHLARAARREGAPQVDVTEAVLRRLRDRPMRADASMAVVAAASSVAAAVTAAAAVQAWQGWQDPLVGLLCSMNTVLQ